MFYDWMADGWRLAYRNDKRQNRYHNITVTAMTMRRTSWRNEQKKLQNKVGRLLKFLLISMASIIPRWFPIQREENGIAKEQMFLVCCGKRAGRHGGWVAVEKKGSRHYLKRIKQKVVVNGQTIMKDCKRSPSAWDVGSGRGRGGRW